MLDYFSQMVSNDKKSQEDNEEKSPIESPVIVRKLTPVDARLNRKSMFEQSTAQTTHTIERVNFDYYKRKSYLNLFSSRIQYEH